MPERMGIKNTSDGRKIKELEGRGSGCQGDQRGGPADERRSVGFWLHWISSYTREFRGKGENEPQGVVCEAKNDTEEDVIRVVETREKSEI